MANRLSAVTSARVLLIEAGPADRHFFARLPNGMGPMLSRGIYSKICETEPQTHLEGRTLSEIRGRVLGGNTTINGAQHSRGAPQDFDRWAELGNPGWAYADVLPFFKKSESAAHGEDAFRGRSGPFKVSQAPLDHPVARAWVEAGVEAGHPLNQDMNGASPVGVGAPDQAVFNGRRTSSSTAYLKPVLSRRNLTVMTETSVEKLLLEQERCTGVAINRKGQREEVEAGHVILCAGAFGSPQLLMLSGIGDPDHLQEHGIEIKTALPGVGENLSDHLGFQVGMTGSQNLSDLRYAGKAKGGMSLMRWAITQKGFFAHSSVRAIGMLCSDHAQAHEPGWPDLKLQLATVLMDESGARLASEHGFHVRISMTRPSSVGTLRLRSADPADDPAIDGNYLADPLDIDRARSGIRLAREIYEQAAMAEFVGKRSMPSLELHDDAALEQWLRRNAGSDAHAIGTCRMGTDEGAVVDPQLNVRGVEGLSVVDGSVLPAHVAGNTTAPILMVAEKAASIMLGQSA